MKIMHWLFLLGLWACGGKTHTNSPVPLIIVDSNFLEKQAKAMDTAALVHTKKETPRDCSDSSLYKSVMGEMIMSLTTAQDSIFGLKMGNPLMDSIVMVNAESYLKELLLCNKLCHATEYDEWIAEIDTFDVASNRLSVKQLRTRSGCTYKGTDTRAHTDILLLPTQNKEEYVVVFIYSWGGGEPSEQSISITAWKWNSKIKKWNHYHYSLPLKISEKLFFAQKQSSGVYTEINKNRYSVLNDGINKLYYNFKFDKENLVVNVNCWMLEYDNAGEKENLPQGASYNLYYKWDMVKEQFIFLQKKLNL